MEQLPQDQELKQVHTEPEPAEQEPEYTLEEIMREFGGWSHREEEAPPEPPTAEKPEPEGAQQAQDAPARDTSGDTVRFTPIRDPEEQEPERPKIWTYKGEPAPEPTSATEPDAENAAEAARRARAERAERKRLKRMERLQKKQAQQKKARQPEQPETVFASAEVAYQAYC